MRIVTLAALAAIGWLAATPVKADWTTSWPFAPPFGFGYDGTHYYSGTYYRARPYVVTGFGDDGFAGQRRYWGGPFFVERRGFHPPYESYAAPRYRHCHSVLVTRADGAERHVWRCGY